MSYVISHLTLFPVIFTIPPSTAFPKLSKHKDETLPTSWTCYLPPYFSVTFTESLSLRTFENLTTFPFLVESCSKVFLLFTSLLPHWHWPVCAPGPEQKVFWSVHFSKVNFLLISYRYFDPVKDTTTGWLGDSYCKTLPFHHLPEADCRIFTLDLLVDITMKFASTNPSIKVRNLTFYIFLESLWCRQRLGTCWKWQRHTQRQIQNRQAANHSTRFTGTADVIGWFMVTSERNHPVEMFQPGCR